MRTQVDIDAMQFGFMSGRGTSDAIFILQQVHEIIIPPPSQRGDEIFQKWP